jgi:glutathione S-transferase
MTEEAFLELANSKPLRKEFLLTMGRQGFPKAEMDGALDRLNRAVVRMNEWITQGGGLWLMGDRISLADIAIMPVIVRMDDINLQSSWHDMPAVARWLEAIRAHPAFRPTYYHGSLLTEKYPHLASLRNHRTAVA